MQRGLIRHFRFYVRLANTQFSLAQGLEMDPYLFPAPSPVLACRV